MKRSNIIIKLTLTIIYQFYQGYKIQLWSLTPHGRKKRIYTNMFVCKVCKCFF